MFCPKCGATIGEGFKFCRSCGADVSSMTQAPEAAGTESIAEAEVQEQSAPIEEAAEPEVVAEEPAVTESAPSEEIVEAANEAVEEAEPVAEVNEEVAEASEEAVEEAQPEVPAEEAVEPVAEAVEEPQEAAEATDEAAEAVEDVTEAVEEASEAAEEVQPAAEESALATVEPAPAPAPIAEGPTEIAEAAPAAENAGENPVQPQKAEKKGGIGKFIIIGVAAAAVLVIGIVIAIVAIAASSKSNAYVYLTDGEYELITNLKGKAENPIELGDTKSDSTYYATLQFTPDGKYAYYFTKVDENRYTGTLVRAEIGKLKPNGNNDKYIEVIANKVSLGFVMMDNGGIVYSNEDDNLYYYDGKESVKFAKEYSDFYTDHKTKIVFTTYNDNYSMTLYGVEIKNIEEKIKLASNVSYVYYTEDMDNIYFCKVDDDYNSDLYVVGFDKDPEKIAKDVYVISNKDGKLYYAEETDTVSPYDYVIDDKADADKGIVEPLIDDYATPDYEYWMCTYYYGSESDYEEMYTSTTQPLYWYSDYTWYTLSMEESLNYDLGTYSDEIHAATRNFINRFGSSANEDGYIYVTAEVKEALKAINNADPYNSDWSWTWLCYDKELWGYTYDYDAYYADYDIYWEAADRISLRNYLQSEDSELPVYSIYVYQNGESTLIAEDVLDYDTYNNCVIFNTKDMITATKTIDEIDWYIGDLVYVNPEDENYILTYWSDTPFVMSSSAADTFADALENEYSYVSLYAPDNSLILKSDSGELYEAVIDGTSIKGFDLIADCVDSVTFIDNKIYYYSDSYESGGAYFADFYVYENEKATLLAQDILSYGVQVFEDGVILAYTDYESRDGYEVTMFTPNGDKTVIGDEITMYTRIDSKTILFISDGDLCCYNGKEKVLIQTDVDYFWCKNYMKPVNFYNYSSYDYYY